MCFLKLKFRTNYFMTDDYLNVYIICMLKEPLYSLKNRHFYEIDLIMIGRIIKNLSVFFVKEKEREGEKLHIILLKIVINVKISPALNT